LCSQITAVLEKHFRTCASINAEIVVSGKDLLVRLNAATCLRSPALAKRVITSRSALDLLGLV
jgi:hypothetical protein